MKSKEKGFEVPDKTKILPGNVPSRTFNAFKLMEQEASGSVKVKVDAEMEEKDKKVTVAMEGKTYDVQEDGTVDAAELDYPKNRVLMFTGAGEAAMDIRAMKVCGRCRACCGLLTISSMQAALEPAYKAKYITKDYDNKDFSSGFVLFESTLGELSIQKVTEKLPKVGDQEVTWAAPSGALLSLPCVRPIFTELFPFRG